MIWAALALAAALLADTLRRVYSVGTHANDHFVAVVCTICMGWYGFLAVVGPWLPLWVAGMVGIWGLFFCLTRPGATPTWARLALGVPSQLAYAFALWGGLSWLLRAPLALLPSVDLWWAGWGLVPALGLSVLGCAQALRPDRVRRHTVEGLPGRLVQLSDLHASPLMHRRELDALVDRVNALEPQLVVITGDHVMPFSEADHGYLLDALRRLDAPAFACVGNHDLPVLERLTQGMADAGAPVLVDRAEQHGAWFIAGVNFHWTDARAELERALDTLPPGDGFRVLMAHDPRLGPWLPADRFDLVLSGHTHGGQVAANMLGLPISALRLFGVRDQGWFPVAGGRQYVHSGNWRLGLPPRMGVGGEIAVFDPAPS